MTIEQDSAFLLGNFQSIAALTIAANLAYLNIQNLKYSERCQGFIRNRIRVYSKVGRSISKPLDDDSEYERIYRYGDLHNFEVEFKPPTESYSSSFWEGLFYYLFMRPLGRELPITIDKLIVAISLTYTVILLLYITNSFAIGPNFFFSGESLGAMSTASPEFQKFYFWYGLSIWILPLSLIAVRVVVYAWDSAFAAKGADIRPMHRPYLIAVSIVTLTAAMYFFYADLEKLLTIRNSVNTYWLNTWIYLCGILLFVPTYFVTFASLFYPSIERSIERDLSKLSKVPAKEGGAG